MPYETQSVPKMDVLRAAILNALSSPIPQNTQSKILNAQNPIESILQSSIGLGQATANKVNPFQRTPIQQSPAIPQSVPVKPEQVEQATSQGGGFPLKQFLARLGVPLGSAILGTVAPGTLPQAAGMATGYENELSRQAMARAKAQGQGPDEFQIDQEARRLTKDKLGGEIVKPDSEEFQREYDKNRKALRDLYIPQTKTGEAVKQTKERITVINQEGQKFTVPFNQLEEAQKQGFMVAE